MKLPSNRQNTLAISGLSFLVIAFFTCFLWRGEILLLRDLVFRWYVWQDYYHDTLMSGQIPLWHPYLGLGEPFLADIQTATLYPLSLIFLFFSPGTGTIIGSIIHCFIAAFGTYWLGRQWRCSIHASTIMAIAFALSAMLLTRIEFYAFFAATAWCPLALATFVRACCKTSIGNIMQVGVVLGMQFLAGYPEASIFTIAALFLYGLCHGVVDFFYRREIKASLRPIIIFITAIVIMVGLTAVQWLPTWELQSQSYRADFDPELHKGSASPFLLFSLIYPFIYGVPGHMGKFWGPQVYEYWVGTIYMGLLPILVLFTYVLTTTIFPKQKTESINRTRKKIPTRKQKIDLDKAIALPDKNILIRRTALLYLCILSIGSFLYAMGSYTPFFTILWHVVPILQKFRWPTKILMLFVLAICVLMGFAWDKLSQKADDVDASRNKLIFVMPGLLGVGIGVFFMLAMAGGGSLGHALLNIFFNMGTLPETQQNIIPWADLAGQAINTAIFAILSGLLMSAYLLFRAQRNWIFLSLLVLLVLDLYRANRPILLSGSENVLSSDHAFISKLDEARGEQRFLEHNTLTQFWLYGVDDVNTLQQARGSLAGTWLWGTVFQQLHKTPHFYPVIWQVC